MVRGIRALLCEQTSDGDRADTGGVAQQWTRVPIKLRHGGDATAALHWVPTVRSRLRHGIGSAYEQIDFAAHLQIAARSTDDHGSAHEVEHFPLEQQSGALRARSARDTGERLSIEPLSVMGQPPFGRRVRDGDDAGVLDRAGRFRRPRPRPGRRRQLGDFRGPTRVGARI